jgi:hypothetical protein
MCVQSASGVSYISLTDPATSGHNRSISSFNRRRANERKAGSGSERKPTTPAAEVRPTIVALLTGTKVGQVRLMCSSRVEARGSCCGSRWKEMELCRSARCFVV